MKPEYIKQILQKYFDGESNQKEEQELQNYFLQDEVDADLLPYKDLFSGFSELKETKDEDFEDSIMDFIIESEHQEKNKYRRLWQTVTGIAAALLIALTVINYTNDRSTWDDTYTDPEIAYTEATKTLQYVAGKYKKGVAQLEPVTTINEAIEPLEKGLNSINTGFDELEKINKKQ